MNARLNTGGSGTRVSDIGGRSQMFGRSQMISSEGQITHSVLWTADRDLMTERIVAKHGFCFQSADLCWRVKGVFGVIFQVNIHLVNGKHLGRHQKVSGKTPKAFLETNMVSYHYIVNINFYISTFRI